MKSLSSLLISLGLLIGIIGVLNLAGCKEDEPEPVVTPSVSTNLITNITTTEATGGGSVTTDGNGEVTFRGIVWNTSTEPTISLSTKTSDGTGTGNFTSTMTNLTPGTQYFVRSYATNSAGTAYGQEVSFETEALSVPTLTTTAIAGITITSAAGGGNITDDGDSPVTERGIVWDTNTGPETTLTTRSSDGSGTGTFTSSITGLSPGTMYFVRAYAINSIGTAYGNEVSFQTESPTVPTLTTTAISGITATTAVGGGNITNDGEADITERGIVWDISASPVITLSTKTSNGAGTGSFSSTLVNLSAGTQYFVRAYATNSAGTAYGNEVSFQTPAPSLATLTTTEITGITTTSATGGGNIKTDGNDIIIERGIIWDTSTSPTIALTTKTSDGSATGSFTSSLTGLTAGTQYFVRAYATNSVGTAYGNEVSFQTNDPSLASLTTSAILDITSTTAKGGGNITSDGDADITERGIVWDTSIQPTIALSTKTSNGTGVGAFTSELTNLNPSTQYFVRAYATNSVGTSYGSEVSFETPAPPAALPTVLTDVFLDITTSSTTGGGNVTDDGGAAITARGVVWDTTTEPTVDLSTKTTDGTGTGTFASSIIDLTPGTEYFVRAYGTNSVGTAYGEEYIFFYYTSITIGTQTWAKENLRASRYSDGTEIPLVTSNSQWANLTTPGYTWIGNDKETWEEYGPVYNWYTVDATSNGGSNPCPVGWHVPSDSEWNTLSNFLGFNGGKLKEVGTTYWLSPNDGATDEFGFSARGAGWRNPQGNFANQKVSGHFWSTFSNSAEAWYRGLSFGGTGILVDESPKRNGFSVRCLKD